MTVAGRRTLPLEVVGALARIGLGLLWIGEGVIKLRAGFGASDILLVADGADGSRAASAAVPIADLLMRPLAGLLGPLIPFLEVGLGLVLVLGVLVVPAAVVAAGVVGTYWAMDLLTVAYPAMVVLTALVLATAAHQGATSPARLFVARRRRRAGEGTGTVGA